MTAKTLEDIELQTEISAPIDRVWQTMVGADAAPNWLGCIGYRREVGHVFYMQQDQQKRSTGSIDGATHCQILELKDRSKFVFSWYFPDTPKTYVSISIEKLSPTHTSVEFSHSGWNQFDAAEIGSIRDALADGWASLVMPRLKTLCEQGT